MLCSYIPCPSKVPLNNWAVFYNQRCAAEAEELTNVFSKLSGPMGVKVGRPRRVPMKNDYTDTYVKSIHAQVTSEVCQAKLNSDSVVLHLCTSCLHGLPDQCQVYIASRMNSFEMICCLAKKKEKCH